MFHTAHKFLQTSNGGGGDVWRQQDKRRGKPAVVRFSNVTCYLARIQSLHPQE